MPRDDDARLLDMLIACRNAMRFVADVSWEEFVDDEITRLGAHF